MEEFFGALAELFCELYFGLVTAAMPDKEFGKCARFVLNAICVVITLAVLIAVFFGIALLIQADSARDKRLGAILLSVRCGFIALHLIVFIVQRALKRKHVKDLERRGVAASQAIGSRVHVTVDRKKGSASARPDIIYELNCGYISGVTCGDGEEQDAYIVGVDEPIDELDGVVIAVVHRLNDVEDKWVVAPEGVKLKKDEIKALTNFRERSFKTVIFMRPRK